MALEDTGPRGAAWMRRTLTVALASALILAETLVYGQIVGWVLALGAGQAGWVGRIKTIQAAAATQAAPAPDPHPLLRLGDRGSSVIVLQTVLKEVGLDPGPIDGIFGPQTERAVREMQKAAGQKVDGVARPETWESVAVRRQIRAGVWQVKPGESLWAISARTSIPLEDLVAWNKLADPRLICSGQKIALKAPQSGSGAAAALDAIVPPPSAADGGLRNGDVAAPDDSEEDVAIPAMAPAAPKRSPRVALTFDDGPTPQTAAILKALAEYGAPATFFMVGEKAANYATIARSVTLAGQDVGSHGYQHRVLTGLSESDIITDVAKAQGIIFAVTGHRPQMFRPPGGASDASVAAALERFGLTTVYWSNAFGDEEDDPTKVAADLLGTTRDGAILMLRETNPAEVAALPLFLQAARKAGISFVPLDEVLSIDR